MAVAVAGAMAVAVAGSRARARTEQNGTIWLPQQGGGIARKDHGRMWVLRLSGRMRMLRPCAMRGLPKFSQLGARSPLFVKYLVQTQNAAVDHVEAHVGWKFQVGRKDQAAIGP